MAFPFEHYYLQLSGTVRSLETFSIGFRMSAAFADDTPAGETAALDALAAVCASNWSATGSAVSNQSNLTTVKYNRIGLDGKYLRNFTNVKDLAPAAQGGGSGTTPMPNQITLVGTLETGATRGLAHRGRVYLPTPPYSPSSANGTISAANATSAATWLGGFISALNGAVGSGDVVVASSGSTKVGAPPEGAQRTVTSVTVGTVYDTMRSRRTSVPEIRSEAAVTNQSGGGGGTF